MRGIEYIELTADSIIPEMFRDFSRRQECRTVLPQGSVTLTGTAIHIDGNIQILDAESPGGSDILCYTVDWDDGGVKSVCDMLIKTLSEGGVVIGAYISEEEDSGEPVDDGDFVAVECEEPEQEEPEPYDWYIEDEEEPPCRAVVGFCAVEPGRIRGELDPGIEYAALLALCVSEEYRRKGIGKGLFRRAVRAARTLDAQRLFADARPDTDTLSFLAAMGFKKTSRIPAEEADDAGQETEGSGHDEEDEHFELVSGSPTSSPLYIRVEPDDDSYPHMLRNVPMEFDLFPRSGNGVITLEEYEVMAGKILDSLPREFFEQLNGGVVVRPEAKIHSQSVPEAPMFVMGEYTRSNMMGRMIYLYYGSFAAMCGRLPRPEQRERLRGIIAHEFRHHMEWLSGTRDLEDEDERGLRAYLLRFAKKSAEKSGRKKKPDSGK